MTAKEAYRITNDVLMSKVNQSVLRRIYYKIEGEAKIGNFFTFVIIEKCKHCQAAIKQVLKNNGFNVSYKIDNYCEQFGGEQYTRYDISWDRGVE